MKSSKNPLQHFAHKYSHILTHTHTHTHKLFLLLLFFIIILSFHYFFLIFYGRAGHPSTGIYLLKTPNNGSMYLKNS